MPCRGADDDIVELAVPDGIPHDMGIGATPRGGVWMGNQVGEGRVGQQVGGGEEDPVGHVAGVAWAVLAAGEEGAGDGADAVGGDDQVGGKDLAAVRHGTGVAKVVGDDLLVAEDLDACRPGGVQEGSVEVGAVHEVVRCPVLLDQVVEGEVGDGGGVLPPDKMIAL